LIKTNSLDIRVSKSFFSRAVGLLRRQPLAYRDALWLKPCRSIHTFGMREPLSVLFLDANNEPLEWIYKAIPKRIYRVRGAASVIEMACRPESRIATIHEEILDMLSGIDEGKNFSEGRIEGRVQNTPDKDIKWKLQCRSYVQWQSSRDNKTYRHVYYEENGCPSGPVHDESPFIEPAGNGTEK
jgi:uncharacterized membrane protein (UPF0127 family)